MKFFIATFFYFFLTLLKVCSQDAGQIRNDCQNEINELNNKMRQLNDEYEKIKEDMRAGLFCSKCGNSKTELDKTEGFYKHLGNVKGEAVSATQAQMNEAHQRYLGKFNSFKSQAEQKSKSCNERINNAVEQQNRKQEEERQNNLRKQQDLQRQAYEKAEQERLAEQQRLEQIKQQLAQQEAERRQKLVEESEKRKQDANEMFKNNATQIKNEISNINMPSEEIGYKNNSESQPAFENNVISKTSNMDDFDFDANKNEFLKSALEDYWDNLKDQTVETIIDEYVSSPVLNDLFKESYAKFNEIKSYTGVYADMISGEITTNTTDKVFSLTPNALISKYQKSTFADIIHKRDALNPIVENLFNEELSDGQREQMFNETVKELLPTRFLPTFSNERKEWTMKDYAKAGVFCVAGGLALTAGAPLWAGIGAAAWYGFTH